MNDSVHGSGNTNIILNEAREIMGDCKRLSLSFRESDAKVIEDVCDLIKGN